MFNLQHGKAKVFFENLTPSQSEDDLESIVVTHLLPGRKTFIDGVNRRAPVKHIIPKPSSVALSEIQIMDTDYDVQQITRNSSAETLRRLVEEHSGKVSWSLWMLEDILHQLWRRFPILRIRYWV